MATKKISSLDVFDFLSPVAICFYLLIGFIPNWEAVDKIAPQWLAMTILNVCSFTIFFLYRKILYKRIILNLLSGMTLTYIAFILWGALSYFYAINPTEVIVNISRQVNVLFMYISMGIFVFGIKQKHVYLPWIITIILGVEVYYLLNEAIEMLNSYGAVQPGILKGVTANRNIAAFSIAIKIPFVLYLIFYQKRTIIKILNSFLIFLSITSLLMIQSRASFIGVFLIVISFIVVSIFLYRKEKKNFYLYSLGYLLIPLVFSIILNKAYFAEKGADALSRAETIISISPNDGSISQRLRYYEDVFKHFIKNPIFGTGLGNWKLKSIDYDSKDIVGYVVPYHAHSDFIQLGAELGLFGFLLYLGIFLWAIYYCIFFLKLNKSNIEEKVFLFLLLTALGVYLIDANLNFPIARPQVLVTWGLIMSIIMDYYQKNNLKNEKEKIKLSSSVISIYLVFSILILVPSLYVSNSVYKSLKGQMFLLQDFNSNQFNIPLNKVEHIVPDIPNITVTTIPINSVKARYFYNANKYEKALDLLDKGTSANPYLFYSEILKSQIFEKKGMLDSAKIYAKKAFYGLPNNDLHASRYVNLINITKDKKALEEAFKLLTRKNNLNNWKNYLLIASNIDDYRNNLKIKERAQKAIKIFPNNGEIRNLYNRILIGEKELNQSIEFSNKGLKYFSQNDFKNAAIQFENAINSNPLNYAFYENAATSNYMIGNLDKALSQINKVIDELNPLNGKCEYIKALIYIRLGDVIGACPFLEISKDSGFSESISMYDKYCNY